MKNVTISVPEDVYREARIKAAEMDTSLSAMVAEYLRSITGRDAEFDRLEAQQERIRREIEAFSAGDRLDRDLVHERALR
jgi:cell division protein FtsB